MISAEPLLDMLQLSGYGKIYSELFDKPDMWQIFENTWNKYLDNVSDKDSKIELLVNTYQFRLGRRGLGERDLWKTNWELELNGELREMELLGDRLSSRRQNNVNHKSPLIRALCQGGYEPFIKSEEIFILMYLLPKYSGSKINFTDNHRFLETLEEEKSNSDAPKN